MARSNELRKLVNSQLKKVCDNVYYRIASDEKGKMYPHIVFEFFSTYLPDLNRTDYTINIDVWTKNQSLAEDLADEVEDTFNSVNLPQDTICPTFYISNRATVEDVDKEICHIIIKVVAQNYER